jgi:four helix bundle protein
MKINKFEDIEAWQEARILTNQIYNLNKTGKISKDFGLKDQLQRASVSIMANIAEGFDSRSNNHFINFLSYAYRSTSEVQSLIYVAKDQNYYSLEQFNKLYKLTVKIKGLIGGFIKYLKK